MKTHDENPTSLDLPAGKAGLRRAKQDALLILIEESVLLSYEQKLDIIDEFPRLTEEQVDALGAFLAAEEKIREEFPEDIQLGVEKVLSEIVGEKIETPDNKVYIGMGLPAQAGKPS